MVGRKWEFRKGFEGFRFVCPSLSKPSLGLAADDQGFVRAAQNGTFYTNDQFVISGYVDTDACKFCGLPDSTSHRYWTCAASQPSRDLIDPRVTDALPDLPPCTLQHGWATEPESVRDFKSALTLIPDTCRFTLGDLPRDHLDLFCDGAGRDPAVPMARLVAWAVVLAGSDHTQCHRPISWGGVPGQWQTVVRAELTAFLSALHTGCRALQVGATFAIWSDSEFTIKRARAIQSRRFHVNTFDFRS